MKTITMQYSQNATADVDEVFVPEPAQRPVHVNCGQAKRIGQMALAERHDDVAVHNGAARAEARIELEHQMRDTLFRRAPAQTGQ